ncbi:UTP--glucose-1-phosphate uridylyltransferase [Patescibacteria group bacterium]|nr:UTP--glucose-1-phosphate uridylyltransferase [Patescibacteria group bacterium]MBU1682930.1 UTP--glucose-1-phosphate uridylyltransferase [Patescibacteria group bacterium]MBU1935223.1 UTP--glucose-1-phosphate uridylyltransferase [Patescibacteria group bacterium]
MKVKKAVLPVAGVGTRFLPATKVVPKELFPIVDKPVIQYLVEEAVLSGIEEIIFVISKGKELIIDHFSPKPELEDFLRQKGKMDILEKVKPIHDMAKFSYVYQDSPLGDGHAVLQAEKLVGGEPFLVLFGDDIVKHEIPAAKQLLDNFFGESIIAVEKVPMSEISAYGVIEPGDKKGELYSVKSLVEKPDQSEAPSDLGIIGKYVCPPEIFDALKKSTSSKGGEIRLIDGFITLSKDQGIWACQIKGERFDTGKAEGLVEANKAFLNF